MSRKKSRARAAVETVSQSERPLVDRAAPASAPPLAPEANRLSDWLLRISFVTLALLLGITELADTDLWWHLRTGQLIVERGQIPHTDWFTYSNPDSPWIDLHWGFQLLVAGLWKLGGLGPVILFTAAVGAATFALLASCRRRDWSTPQTVACLLPALLLFGGRYHPRPEILTQLLLVATLALLFRVRQRPWLAWLLPAVQLVWVNVHSLFILGWIVWVAFLTDAAARWLFPRLGPAESPEEPRDQPRDFARWGAVSVLMLAADLANPYGLEGLLFPLVIFTRISSERDFYKLHAGEFQSMGEFLETFGSAGLFTNLSTVMLMLLAALGLASFVLLALRKRVPVDRVLLFAAFGYLAWQANRNAALFALVGGYVLRTNLGEWSSLSPGRSRGSALAGLARPAAMLAMTGLLLAVPLEIFSFLRPIATMPLRFRLFGMDEVRDWHAHQASAFLAEPGMPREVYAMHLGQAAVYLFHNGPERRVFADPRLEVNTRDTLQRTLDILAQLLAHDPAAEENLRRGIEPGPDGARELPALLFDRSTILPRLPQMLSNPRWRLVYADPVALVFLSDDQAAQLKLRRLTMEDLLRD